MADDELRLSAGQQRRVWEGQLASEIRAIFFADLCNHYQRMQRIVTWMTLAASSGAAVTLLTDWLPPGLTWVKPVLALLTAALSIWSIVQGYPKRAYDCADLQFRYRKLATAFATLWDDMYAADALDTLNALEATDADLEKSSLLFPKDRRRMAKWQAHVERQHAASATA